ncbi:MAG: hypothetical protein NT028_06275 [candidate division Zixibacteria bacterium]|nr:hypothetical protein [candidate division Zixibacteria bacterium]
MKSAKCLIVLTAVIGCFYTVQLDACSVCRCGDNAFLFSERGFGLPGQTELQRFWFSVGNLYSTKSNALTGDEGTGTERQREIRPSLRMAFNPSQHASFMLELPLQYRRIVVTTADATDRERSSGVGDLELSTVWTHTLSSNNGRFYTGGLAIVAKLPTGSNNLRQMGERLDEHLQAGTGTVDWQLGAAASRLTCTSRFFTSVYYRRNGTNDFGYHYGNAVLFNLGAERPLIAGLTGSLQVNGRYADRDHEIADMVENTGGWVAYISPGLRLSLTQALGISAAVQVPVYQNLYGVQSEKAVLSTGLSVTF